MDMDRNIYEGYTPRDFIRIIEPEFVARHKYEPFTNRKEVAEFCTSRQPFYGKQIPEVIKYFMDKYVKGGKR